MAIVFTALPCYECDEHNAALAYAAAIGRPLLAQWRPCEVAEAEHKHVTHWEYFARHKGTGIPPSSEHKDPVA